MDLSFRVMFEDEVVAKIDIKDSKLVLAETYTNITYKQPFLKKPITLEYVTGFLKRRAIPKNKSNIKEILNSMGLESYDTIKILKNTHGVNYDDFTWIKFANEIISWQDVKLR